MRPIKYTDGSNGIVRLTPPLWRAFYEAAQYMEYPSVQDCFIDYIQCGFSVRRDTDFVEIVTSMENSDRPDMGF